MHGIRILSNFDGFGSKRSGGEEGRESGADAEFAIDIRESAVGS